MLLKTGLFVGVMSTIMAVAGAAVAQDYPTRNITMITPYAPGATDQIARVVGEVMREDLGVPIIVESRPGAGGAVGAQSVASANPDGYTLLFAYSSVHTLAPNQQDLGYGFDDLVPVARIATGPNVLGARAGVPFSTLEELVEYARENPGDVSFATAGTGGQTHLQGEAFAKAAGIELFHIPFQGVAPAVTATVAGDVDLIIGAASTLMPQVDAGTLIAIAQFGDERASVTPDLPTFLEQGVDVSVPPLVGLWAPAGTPPEIVARLSESLGKALSSPQIVDYGNSVLFEFNYADTETFAAQLQQENELNRQILEELGL